MGTLGLVNHSPANVWRERGFQDGDGDRPDREEAALKRDGPKAAAAYRVGRRRGREVREQRARDDG